MKVRQLLIDRIVLRLNDCVLRLGVNTEESIITSEELQLESVATVELLTMLGVLVNILDLDTESFIVAMQELKVRMQNEPS